MRQRVAKIFMFVAVMLIALHNAIPHHHDASALTAHHHDRDGHRHGVFSHDFLAHTFVRLSTEVALVKYTTIQAFDGQVVEAKPLCAVNEYFEISNSQYSLWHEFPPPQSHFSSSGFCGPPVTVLQLFG